MVTSMKMSQFSTLYQLIAVIFFARWGYMLVSDVSYLLSDPTSYLFWSVSTKRVLMAALISSGLVVCSLDVGKKYWPLTVLLLLISLLTSLLLPTETGTWIFWAISAFIHCSAIFSLYKTRPIKTQPISAYFP